MSLPGRPSCEPDACPSHELPCTPFYHKFYEGGEETSVCRAAARWTYTHGRLWARRLRRSLCASVNKIGYQKNKGILGSGTRARVAGVSLEIGQSLSAPAWLIRYRIFIHTATLSTHHTTCISQSTAPARWQRAAYALNHRLCLEKINYATIVVPVVDFCGSRKKREIESRSVVPGSVPDGLTPMP